MSIDKISALIEEEVEKAITEERQRILEGLKDLLKGPPIDAEDSPQKELSLGDEIKEPQEEDEKSDKAASYDISEVEDEEAKDDTYYESTLPVLRKEAERRGLVYPGSYKKLELVKLLILDDEENS